jgi:hypothetical protein
MTMAALAMTSVLTVSAQTPQRPPNPQTDTTQRKQQDATQRAGAAANAQAVTVTGCLKAEKDVPGRRPDAAERGGVADDYILTNVKMATASPTSAIGLASSYQIEGIAAAELQKHLNHQVEIVGTISQGNAQGNRGASAAAGSAASANADLPQLQGTTLKMLSATCPAAQ